MQHLILNIFNIFQYLNINIFQSLIFYFNTNDYCDLHIHNHHHVKLSQNSCFVIFISDSIQQQAFIKYFHSLPEVSKFVDKYKTVGTILYRIHKTQIIYIKGC